jgi:hypothetical protein
MTTARSADAQAIIYDGVPVTTLGEIFGLDHKEVKKRIHGRVQPVDAKKMTYRIRDAAPFLCDLKMDPEEMIKSLSPSKLPPALQDAFWKAQNSRQKWEENRGDLWRTHRVFEVVTGAFKVVRMTLMMFTDTVSQRTSLSEEQRRIMQELIDGLMASLKQKLVDEFTFYEPQADEHGMPLSAQKLAGQESDEEALELAEQDPFA